MYCKMFRIPKSNDRKRLDKVPLWLRNIPVDVFISLKYNSIGTCRHFITIHLIYYALEQNTLLNKSKILATTLNIFIWLQYLPY